jgi:hypothetical protein
MKGSYIYMFACKACSQNWFICVTLIFIFLHYLASVKAKHRNLTSKSSVAITCANINQMNVEDNKFSSLSYIC